MTCKSGDLHVLSNNGLNISLYILILLLHLDFSKMFDNKIEGSCCLLSYVWMGPDLHKADVSIYCCTVVLPKLKFFPSKGGGGGLRSWEQFPSYTL